MVSGAVSGVETVRGRRLPDLVAGAALMIVASAAACQAIASEWAPRPKDTLPRAAPEPIQDENEARGFAAHALALRAEIVGGGGAAVLARIPGGSAALWPGFFENAMAAFGRLRSSAPAALYYNPLLDVAVTTVWERRHEGWQVAAVRVLPGERLDGGRGAAPPLPSWLSAGSVPFEALFATTAARLDAFHRAHPPEATEAAQPAATFAERAADARAAQPRLTWHARQHVRWASGAEPWLRPTLKNISAALSAGDAKAVTAAAPATDAATAEAVAGLPDGLSSRLVLDMVLAAGKDLRLLIGSLPDDGEMYFLVQCHLQETVCSLHRIVMISLLERSGEPGRPIRSNGG